MPAEDRARKPGAQPSAPQGTGVPTGGPKDESAGSAGAGSGVSMRALLDSCAAADAVSTPPSDGQPAAESDGQANRRGAARDEAVARGEASLHDEPARGTGPAARPGLDAA